MSDPNWCSRLPGVQMSLSGPSQIEGIHIRCRTVLHLQYIPKVDVAGLRRYSATLCCARH